MSKRTVRDWESNVEVMPVVEYWASESGYQPAANLDGGTEYVRTVPPFPRYFGRSAWWTTWWHVTVRQTSAKVHLEAWIVHSCGIRVGSLGLVPKEMGVQGGGFRDRFGRWLARKPVNILLSKLGQPHIR